MFRTYVALCVWAATGSTAFAQAPVTTVWFGSAAEVRPHAQAPAAASAGPEAPASSPSNVPSVEEVACPGPVHLVRNMGGPLERMRAPLLDCQGRPRLEAQRQLAILMRPRQDRRVPTASELESWAADDGDPDYLTARIRVPHPALMARVQALSDALGGVRLEILSGHRPQSLASRHALGRALDLRSADPEALHAAAIGLPRSGVGWHPERRFLHLDVRPEGRYWEGAPGGTSAAQHVTSETTTAAPPGGNAAGASRAEAQTALSELQRALGVVVLPSP